MKIDTLLKLLFMLCVTMALIQLSITLPSIDKSLRTISAALVDTGRLGGPLNRIDHNLAIIGDYGIPAQQPNAPRPVR